MNEENPWAKARPATRSPDKRERERSRDEAVRPRQTPSRDEAPTARPTPNRDGPRPWAERPRATTPSSRPIPRDRDIGPGDDGEAPHKPSHREARWYGVNACLAAFAKRPQDLRKVYLVESRLGAMKPVLAWCVRHKLGYRVVESADLDRLTGSRHHEGVCFDMVRHPAQSLDQLLETQPAAPAASMLLWLDGVGNPHNLGALLRSAAHFGAGGVIVPTASSLDLSGAAARVAEGGAEAVPLARIDDADDARARLHAAGYSIVATVPRNGVDLYESELPSRLVLMFGAEGEGISEALIAAADLRVAIPGSGVVESLNIAASAAVVMGEFWRQRQSRKHAG